MQKTKTNLIVSGVACSGVRTLATLLNSHEDIVLGVERFKYRFLLHRDFDVELFERDRFFDFRKDDTNQRPEVRPRLRVTYDRLEAKWDAARVVGDTVPDLTPALKDVMTVGPDVRHIHILRNLKDVALNWQGRAERPHGSWPFDKGFAAACESWAHQYRTLQTLLRTPALKSRVLLLDYDLMFLPDSGADKAILGFLDLAPSDSFSMAFGEQATAFAAEPFRKVPGVHAEDYKSIDSGVAQSLRRDAAAQITAYTETSTEATVTDVTEVDAALPASG